MFSLGFFKIADTCMLVFAEMVVPNNKIKVFCHRLHVITFPVSARNASTEVAHYIKQIKIRLIRI